MLVDYYYAVQGYRIQAHGQHRAIAQESDKGSSHLFGIVGSAMHDLEEQIADALGAYAKAHRPGRWALGITGIGPIITAGLLAHIDIEKAPTVGHIWRFAGLDPSVRWEKGQKRPWNADLKVLCWKIGDSFVKNKGRITDDYGKVYAERKDLEVARNEAGVFADTAAATLAQKNFRDAETRAIYESGKLPAGRLDARARRYAVKLFLAHLHHVMHECHYGTKPPMPYILANNPAHTHYLAPPKWPVE
jgi:hypothetical protein